MAVSVGLPAASTPWARMILAFRQSPPGSNRPMTGLITSSAIEETTFPIAAPMMTPIARARAFCFSRNAWKSFSTAAPPFSPLTARCEPSSLLPRLGLFRSPRFNGPVDLAGVLLEVLGVNRQPVFGGVSARLAVSSLGSPCRLGQPAKQSGRPSPRDVHRRQRELDAIGVVIEDVGPAGLVEGLDRRALLGNEVADAGGRVGLGVSAVADDFVRGPLLRLGSPLPGLAGHARKGIAQFRGAVLVAPDQRFPLLRRVPHRRAESIPAGGCQNEGNPSLPPPPAARD